MIGGWALFGALAGVFALAFVMGLVLGVFTMAKVLQDEWRELREILAPLPAEVEGAATPEWNMRVSPERYLERFPNGERAALARDIVENKRRAAAAF